MKQNTDRSETPVSKPGATPERIPIVLWTALLTGLVGMILLLQKGGI
jgi:hypothetical protein